MTAWMTFVGPASGEAGPMKDLEPLLQDLAGVLLLLRAMEPHLADADLEAKRWYDLAVCTAESGFRQVRAIVEEGGN
jgi:hypothetical protein